MKNKIDELHAKLAAYQELKQIIENRIQELTHTVELQEISNAVAAKTLFPEQLQTLLDFEEKGDYVIITPRRFLGRGKFAKIAAIVRENDGEYVSSGKDSHFKISKRARMKC